MPALVHDPCEFWPFPWLHIKQMAGRSFFTSEKTPLFVEAIPKVLFAQAGDFNYF